MNRKLICMTLLSAGLSLLFGGASPARAVEQYDVLVYGGTSAGST